MFHIIYLVKGKQQNYFTDKICLARTIKSIYDRQLKIVDIKFIDL